MQKLPRNTIIFAGVLLLLIGSILFFVVYGRATALQKARDAVNECDDIEFVTEFKSTYMEHIDADGLNAEPFETRRKAVLAMLDAAGPGNLKGKARIGKIIIKKKGLAILTINIYFRVFEVNGQAFSVYYEGDRLLTRICEPDKLGQNYDHTGTTKEAETILATCEDIEFSNFYRRDLLNVGELNAEPMEVKREIVAGLFSAGKPSEKTGEETGVLTGMISLKKEGKVFLKIILYNIGFRMRFHSFDVPLSACESNERLKHLLCPKILMEEEDNSGNNQP